MADTSHDAVDLRPAAPFPKKILMVAGEESGDVYAGRLCGHLLSSLDGVRIEGIGGPRMRHAGAHTFHDISEMSSVGLASLLGRVRFFMNVLDEMRAKIAAGEYDAVILIDYPDFNLRIAQAADEAGTPVFYYVCPQFWAWRQYRLNAVRRWVDMMLVVFPFEEEFYTKRGINAHFIGHPLLDELEKVEDRERLRAGFGLTPGQTVLGLIPGSRHGEVERMFPLMLKAVKIIRATKPVKVLVPCAASVDMTALRQLLYDLDEEAEVIQGRTWEVMSACDFLICKSGTSTLQATLAGTPMQIVYRFDTFSYWLAKSLTHVKWAGIPNLLADRMIAPELLQGRMTPRNMAENALPYLIDTAKRNEMRAELQAIAATLGQPGASKNAARLIVEYLKKFKDA